MLYRIRTASFGLTTVAFLPGLRESAVNTAGCVAVVGVMGHAMSFSANERIRNVGYSITYAIQNVVPGLLTEYVFRQMDTLFGYGEGFAYAAGLSVTCIRAYHCFSSIRSYTPR